MEMIKTEKITGGYKISLGQNSISIFPHNACEAEINGKIDRNPLDSEKFTEYMSKIDFTKILFSFPKILGTHDAYVKFFKKNTKNGVLKSDAIRKLLTVLTSIVAMTYNPALLGDWDEEVIGIIMSYYLDGKDIDVENLFINQPLSSFIALLSCMNDLGIKYSYADTEYWGKKIEEIFSLLFFHAKTIAEEKFMDMFSDYQTSMLIRHMLSYEISVNYMNFYTFEHSMKRVWKYNTKEIAGHCRKIYLDLENQYQGQIKRSSYLNPIAWASVFTGYTLPDIIDTVEKEQRDHLKSEIEVVGEIIAEYYYRHYKDCDDGDYAELAKSIEECDKNEEDIKRQIFFARYGVLLNIIKDEYMVYVPRSSKDFEEMIEKSMFHVDIEDYDNGVFIVDMHGIPIYIVDLVYNNDNGYSYRTSMRLDKLTSKEKLLCIELIEEINKVLVLT